MQNMKTELVLFMLLNTVHPSCQTTNSEVKQVGGAFENKEFSADGRPARLSNVDTSAGWQRFPHQRLVVSGTIFKSDGKTPAGGVTLYYYHTDVEGRYPHDASVSRSMKPNNQGQTHGYLRGWVKTGSNGRYTIYTSRPASYPNSEAVQHIHLTIDEPGYSSYYIDDIVFDDDVFLNQRERATLQQRGGSGVVKLEKTNGVLFGTRNIVLGKNIPGHRGE